MVHKSCYYYLRYFCYVLIVTTFLSIVILAGFTSVSTPVSASTITSQPDLSLSSVTNNINNTSNNNDNSGDLPTIQITSHQDGQQVSSGELKIEGVSSDDKETNCRVYADVNDTTPMQNVMAAADSGSTDGQEDDFSKWSFTYTEEYQVIMKGENELTAKISCFDDANSSSSYTNTNTGTTTIPVSKWHTINVTAGPVEGDREGEKDERKIEDIITNKLTSSSILNENNSQKPISNIVDEHFILDEFGIIEIYPTKEGGREWYINNTYNPANSHRLFYVTSGENTTTQGSDGSWLINSPQFKLNVKSPPDTEPWKNVEITGYARVLSIIDPEIDPDLTWIARSGRHSNEVPCDGTALTGTIHADGSVEWKKEIWHTGGYTDARAYDKVTDSILGRWIGWKVVVYNINNDTAVKMESYLDDKNNNEWTKVTDLVDDGRWYAKSTDKEFYSAGCNKPKDYIITNSGPLITFRSDNVVWELKNLSVREIDSN